MALPCNVRPVLVPLIVVLHTLPAMAQSGAPDPRDPAVSTARPEPSTSIASAVPLGQEQLHACFADANAQFLSGYAQGAFVSECLAKGAPASIEDKQNGADTAALSPAPTPSGNPQKQDETVRQDEQFKRWNGAANRAIKSICVGCDAPTPNARPSPRKASAAPPVPDQDEPQ